LWRAARGFRQVWGPLTSSAISVSLAIFLALSMVSPFGGGRTDEVIYPAVLLLFAGAITTFATRAASAQSIGRALVAAVLVATGALALVGHRNPAKYPTTELTALYAKLKPKVTPYQFIVVDPWMTFGWGVGGYTKTSVSFAHTLFDWSQGFHVVSDDSHVFISDQYFFPPGTWKYLHIYSHQLWYVGMTTSSSWPTPSPSDQLMTTRNYHALRVDGWVPTSMTLRTAHTIAILMNYVASQDRTRISVPTK